MNLSVKSGVVRLQTNIGDISIPLSFFEGADPQSLDDEDLNLYLDKWKASSPKAEAFPDWHGLSLSLTAGGSHEALFLKALESKAPPLAQGALTSGIGEGNLLSVRSTLELLINSMPQNRLFSEEEINSLNQLFLEKNIPLLVEVAGDGVVVKLTN